MLTRTHPPDLVLGTAMWGWTVEPPTCFALLDAFYAEGGRRVDGATNYPINKVPADFRQAERILARWCRERGVHDLEVIMKVGSLNNLMTPDQNLAPSFLLICAEEYQALLGDNLACLMIHWDNRDDAAAIEATLNTLDGLRRTGLEIGLSGIRHPEKYAELLARLDWRNVPVELKHNLLYRDYERYAPLRPYAAFIAYGLNAGGLKLDPAAYSSRASLTVRGGSADRHGKLVDGLRERVAAFTTRYPELPAPDTMNRLGMLYAAYHSGLSGLLLGPSSVAQLEASRAWLTTLFTEDYGTLYEDLIRLSHAGE